MKDKLENFSVRCWNNILAGVFKFQVTACNFMIAINIFLVATFHDLVTEKRRPCDLYKGFFPFWNGPRSPYFEGWKEF